MHGIETLNPPPGWRRAQQLLDRLRHTGFVALRCAVPAAPASQGHRRSGQKTTALVWGVHGESGETSALSMSNPGHPLIRHPRRAADLELDLRAVQAEARALQAARGNRSVVSETNLGAVWSARGRMPALEHSAARAPLLKAVVRGYLGESTPGRARLATMAAHDWRPWPTRPPAPPR
jgi:hypothetical protein